MGVPGHGDAEKLRRYWAEGEGAAKIRWGAPGDFDRCVSHLEKYMPGRAEGYCNLLHHRALGFYPATHAKMLGKGHLAAAAEGLAARVELAGAFDPSQHPRYAKGDPKGGKFAPKGAAGNSNSAEENAQAQKLFDQMRGMTPQQREAFLAKLSPDQLLIMRQLANSDGAKLDVGSIAALNGQIVSRGLVKEAVSGKGGKGSKDKAAKPKKAAEPKPKKSAAPKTSKPKSSSSGGKSSGGKSSSSKPKTTKPKTSGSKSAPGKSSGTTPTRGQAQQTTSGRSTAAIDRSGTTAPSTTGPSITKPSTAVKTTTWTPTTSPSVGTPQTKPAQTRRRRPQRMRQLRSGQATALSAPTTEATQMAAANLTTAQRDKLAPTAMDDKSYPIPSVLYLRKAIQSFGRCPPSKRAALVEHIRTRAKALGASDLEWVKNFLAMHSA